MSKTISGTPIENMQYFIPQETLVKILIKKTQNHNPLFFRILVAYQFAKLASMMRINIETMDRGVIPINLYAINLSVSGSGKGFSNNIIEDNVIDQFKKRFLEYTFPAISERNLELLAATRANRYNTPVEEMEQTIEKEFTSLGPLVFSFDSGTAPAVKQMRHKLLMGNIGSINLEIDEIGSNLVGNVEVLNTFLELYDVGKIKQKLVKNTAENKRSEDIDGRTPTNMMLYGTPSKLLNGGKTEEEFLTMLETGYARRSLFGYSTEVNKLHNLSPEAVYDMLTDSSTDTTLTTLSAQLERLADPVNYQRVLKVNKATTLKLLEYKLLCEREADSMRDFEEIQKAEVAHRYYKALKLAGAYAFINSNIEITEQDLFAAIRLVEESGESFQRILNRPRTHERIALYLAETPKEVTQVELSEDLPFYKGPAAHKKDIMTQAIAWGYRNNIIIKTFFVDNIEFFKGEALEATNLQTLRVAHSDKITEGFEPEYAPWDRLHELVTLPNRHYTAHHFADKYRTSDNLIKGFNLVILDVDEGISLSTAQMLLKDFRALFATTKRHNEKHNRFRIILPLSHTLKLTSIVYSKFMVNIFNWLPFAVDTSTKDCSRKWESFPGDHYYQEGELLDALMFIPDTNKQQKQQQLMNDNNSLTNIERWFILNSDVGSRSNMLIRYAYVLVDSGHSIEAIRTSISNFNSKLDEPLSDDEINSTILVSAIKAVTKRDMDE